MEVLLKNFLDKHLGRKIIRKGYIAPTHEDDALSGCVTSEDDLCTVCGESIDFPGDTVKNYNEGDLVEIILQFIPASYNATNYLRVCPLNGKFVNHCIKLYKLYIRKWASDWEVFRDESLGDKLWWWSIQCYNYGGKSRNKINFYTSSEFELFKVVNDHCQIFVIC